LYIIQAAADDPKITWIQVKVSDQFGVFGHFFTQERNQIIG
jgi:hypothetical protein